VYAPVPDLKQSRQNLHFATRIVWGWKCLFRHVTCLTFISTARTLKISVLHTVDSTTFTAEVTLTHKLLWRGALPFTHVPQSFNYRRPVKSRHASGLQRPLLLWNVPWEMMKWFSISTKLVHYTWRKLFISISIHLKVLQPGFFEPITRVIIYKDVIINVNELQFPKQFITLFLNASLFINCGLSTECTQITGHGLEEVCLSLSMARKSK